MKWHEMSQFSAKKERAIQSLLQGASVARAAKAAGVTPRTLFRWLADESFTRRLHEAQQSIFDRVTRRLTVKAIRAVTVLSTVMNDEEAPPSARVRAALGVLKLVVDIHNGQIEERLDELCKMVETLTNETIAETL